MTSLALLVAPLLASAAFASAPGSTTSAPDSDAGLGGDADARSSVAQPVCALDHDSAARAVMGAYAELRALFQRRLPGPRGEAILRRKWARLIAAHVDLERFVRGVLRDLWDEGSELQHTRWSMTLEHVLRSRYLDGIGAPGQEPIAILRSLVSCDEAQIRLAIGGVEGHRARVVDIDLVYRPPHWRVYDVSLDGVSLAATWRGRFRRIYRDGGLAAVDRQISRLAERYGVVLPEAPAPDPGAEAAADAGG